MKSFKSSIIIVILVIIGIFSIQNIKLLELKFLFLHIELPAFLFAILFYILGGLTGALLFKIIKKGISNENNR